MSTDERPEDTGATTDETTPEQRPLLRVVNPDATPEEIAALVAVFASIGAGSGGAPAPRRTPEWSAHHRRVRPAHAAGPGAWRSSSLPR